MLMGRGRYDNWGILRRVQGILVSKQQAVPVTPFDVPRMKVMMRPGHKVVEFDCKP